VNDNQVTSSISRSGLVAVGLAVVALVALAAATTVVAARSENAPSSLRTGPYIPTVTVNPVGGPFSSLTPTCIQLLPADAPPQAAAYLNAVNGDEPAWQQVTMLIDENGNRANVVVVETQAAIDREFLRQLKSITFTGPATAPAQLLEATVSTYVADLAILSRNLHAQVASQLSDLDSVRAKASASLRAALHLPPSSCEVLRP
jgi:hypothetical protein